ncbi:MAG: Hsp20/alpha crystallin family protein [Thermodesulfobacteriota bacterium]
MSIVRWGPWENIASLHDRINRIFDETFPRPAPASAPSACDWNPVVDTYETDDTIVIELELPGIDKKDVEINLKDRLLSISGERCCHQEIREESYHRRERCYGTFHRTFILPAFVKPENIKAEFKDGLLKVKIPKPDETKPKQIRIK